MAESLINVNIAKEMKTSFLDYAMSVIVARALPDVRDGLKPVHRRIIYSMYDLGFMPDKGYHKCARIVGDVLGKYHPHGDSSIYDALVRMAQDFSMRYTLVDGHGNFGSIDGDSAAAMRYTEAKMAKIATEMIRDIGKNTIDFIPNFDGEHKEPEVLPSRIPTLLINGSSGIAVGMATNIPPHNIGEVIDGLVAYIENNDIDILGLMSYIKGPDFPTAGIILGNSGIKKAYETGRGVITIRSSAEIEEVVSGKQTIIINEIPYQTNKAMLVTKIADLVRDKIIDGVSDLRDESNREGIRIVIELRREANANVILNNLYKHTSLQTSYGINMLALVDGQPRTLSLKEVLEKYLDHQKVVIIRRTEFDLDKSLKRAHILEGLKIALDNIDEVIKLIKASKTDQTALEGLMNKFGLTEAQAQAILEMKLRRLTGLEREKIDEELKDLLQLIEELKDILSSEEKILAVIKQELLEVREKYVDKRKTKIDMNSIDYIEDESLIPQEEIIVTLTNKGYIKRLPKDTYKQQNRGGVGIKGMTTNEEDVVENAVVLNTHDYVMFFTNKGRTYRVKGYEIPEYGRQAKGLPIVNLLPVDKDESINSILKITADEENQYIVFATKNGIVKRTDIEEFKNIRTSGKIAITLKDDDELIAVKKTTGKNEMLLASSNGRMVRFAEDEIRVMGRSAAGVKGIQMNKGERCVGAEIVDEGQEILVVTEKGYGKKTPVAEYRLTHRGSKGVKTLNVTDKNGTIVAFKAISGNEDLIVVSDNGIVIRLATSQISTMSRVTQGVRLISLKGNQKVSTVAVVDAEEGEETEN